MTDPTILCQPGKSQSIIHTPVIDPLVMPVYDLILMFQGVGITATVTLHHGGVVGDYTYSLPDPQETTVKIG